MKDYYTVKELALLMGVTRSAAWKILQRNDILTTQLPGKRAHVVLISELREFLEDWIRSKNTEDWLSRWNDDQKREAIFGDTED